MLQCSNYRVGGTGGGGREEGRRVVGEKRRAQVSRGGEGTLHCPNSAGCTSPVWS